MTFEKTFCPSPWIHMRIINNGSYEYCRWMNKDGLNRINNINNIKFQSPEEYFQKDIAPIRTAMLNGEVLPSCRDCVVLEKNGKVSGRQRQLLKSGIHELQFEKSLASSPLRPAFDYSFNNQGFTNCSVQDWQIDLGNYCNNACIFCTPESSSRLAAEFKKLNIINQVPANSWCDDPALVEKFVNTLINSKPKYLHFIGGETLITPGFETILTALVNAKCAQDISIGFTTNLNAWSDRIIDLLPHFKEINLGLSIETLTTINDYVRWPNQHNRTLELLNKWVKLKEKHQWLVQLRITPTCLTIHDITTVYDYAWEHNLTVESCNFLYNPKFMRIDVLPQKYKIAIRKKLQNWVDQHYHNSGEKILNIRNPNSVQSQILQDAISYINYLDASNDESFEIVNLVKFLKKLESSRKNNILEYLPEYEELFRSFGY